MSKTSRFNYLWMNSPITSKTRRLLANKLSKTTADLRNLKRMLLPCMKVLCLPSAHNLSYAS